MCVLAHVRCSHCATLELPPAPLAPRSKIAFRVRFRLAPVAPGSSSQAAAAAAAAGDATGAASPGASLVPGTVVHAPVQTRFAYEPTTWDVWGLHFRLRAHGPNRAGAVPTERKTVIKCIYK